MCIRDRSGNSVFQFIVHKFSSRLWNAFSFRKRWKVCCKASKAISLTPGTCSSCVQWFSLWMLSSKFHLPLSAKSGKRLKMKRKISMVCKKAKANVNIDCFSLIKGQWKPFKGQWKVREFLTFWWGATLSVITLANIDVLVLAVYKMFVTWT